MFPFVLLLACAGGSSSDKPGDTSAPTDSGEDTADSADTADSTDTTADDACPSALVSPDALDWVGVTAGGGTPKTVSVVNDCTGTAALSILAEVDQASFVVDPPTLSLGPGGVGSLLVTFTPSTYDPVAGTLTLDTNDPDHPLLVLPLTATVDDDGDDDGDPARAAGGGDCDDTDANVNSTAAEIWYDGIDQDCDGNDQDQDGDGWDRVDDCDDEDPTRSPSAPEIWYDGVDQDCDGNDQDRDTDGWDLAVDCDDTAAAVNPGVAEIWYDGVDQDCDGNDQDQDTDGWDLAVDCDDTDAAVNPGVAEIWYDGVDQDCDGADDYDADGDGQISIVWGGADCDDLAASVYEGAPDAWYDGLDANCDGWSDFDADHDGADSDAWGGTDCDDTNGTVNRDAAEIWYDGVDQNCDGYDDDQDYDGYVQADDCNDTDAAVNHGATEVWYDGADQDCDGADDYDQDGDGVPAYPWGADCADTDALTMSGAAEVLNGLDDDCDGLVDEDLAVAGDVVITEVMANPALASDTYGEWFEVYNAGATAVDLVGWVVDADDGGAFTVGSSLPIAPGGYAVLGVDGTTSLNGGVDVDYVYPRASFSLGDSGDSIHLVSGATTIASLSWSNAWPESAGVAMGLDDDHLDPSEQTELTFWCASTESYGRGDQGTPGAPSSECRNLDDDTDGETTTDCDDDNPDVNEAAFEIDNGIDDNCNGVIDELTWGTFSQPYVEGMVGFGYLGMLGVGDYDGDGETEVAMRDLYGTAVYLLSGPDYAAWRGTITSVAESSFDISTTWDTFRSRSYSTGDVTGDGYADLVYGGVGTVSGSFVVFPSPLPASGGGHVPDVRFENTADAYNYVAVESGFDFNGDGTSEVVFGNSAANRSGASYLGSAGIFEIGGTTGLLGWADATLRLDGSGNVQCGYEVEPGDYDGDGYMDLAVACYGGSLYVWRGDGLATTGAVPLPSVASTTITFTGGFSTASLYSEDLDADGALDLAWTYSDTSSWFFAPASLGTVPSTAADASGNVFLFGGQGALDTNGDGAEERLWADWDGNDSTIFTFDPAAGDDGVVENAEAAWAGVATGYGYGFADAADLDGDGAKELLISSTWYRGWLGGLMVVNP